MAFEHLPTPDLLRDRIGARLAERWKLMLCEGLLLEFFGVLAFTMPLLGTLAVDILVGWLLCAGGLVRVVSLLHARHAPGYWWSLSAGVLAIVVGALLLVNPLRGALTLTTLLAALFFVEGLSAILAGLDFRHHARNWGWLLFRGIIDLGLVFLIWNGWPGTAAWAIGVIAGVNLFFMGLTIVMLAFAVRKT
ncbi:HdeD family acid-resistance protein [Novosphingobium sp. FSW06-99]|uniref:HdeD family acid-resistance protein n=1 Tax=Novosphingobium sp. FSW06-99 TaxID=1739113 RepID=UPI00076CBB63|nr:DUF308 domain-containing protein [Novosphingobium sp. FSW06-99]KUR74711.1 hypothetical protein AQZ49_17645 [Novosphingobium sp. FSW06-99]